MKLSRSLLYTLLACTLGVIPAQAQWSPDVFFGVGTATASSNGQSIDTFGDGNLYNTPKLTGAFGKVGADFMITPHFGVNGEYDFRFSQGAYAGLNYRPSFYDFNGVWMPTFGHFKRIAPEFQAGLGGVNTKFYESSSSCDSFVGCSSSNQFVESSNHFQFHMEAGLRVYVTSHLFIRPQIDAHWINNNFQFGSDWVPEYGASLGWSFRHE